MSLMVFMRMLSLVCMFPRQAILRIMFLRLFCSVIRYIHRNDQEILLPWEQSLHASKLLDGTLSMG